MKKKLTLTKILFLAFFALSLGVCIYQDAIESKPRCLINIGVLAFMMNAYLEKKNYIKKLKEKAEMQDFLINSFDANSPDLMTYTDKNYRFVTCNKTMCTLLGIKTNEEIKDTTVFDHLPLEKAQLIHKYNKEVLETGKNVKYSLYMDDDVYGQKIYETVSVPVHKHEDIIGIITICRDVTFREKLRKKFTEKQNQLNAILNNLPMAAFLIDLNGKFISGNNKVDELLGVEREVLRGCEIFTTYLEETPEEFNKNLNIILKEKRTVTSEHFFKFGDNSPSWYKIYKSPLYDNSGQIQGVTVFMQNIGAEKEIDRQKEHFIATLSHDLKTPIIAQTRSLELLLKGSFGEIDPNQKELLDLTLESCKNLYNMVSTILCSYKFDNNEIKLNFADISVTDLVIDCCDELSNQTKEKNIEIIINPSLQRNYINADIRFLKFAILYLIENSISYAYENTKIKIDICDENDEITLKIHTDSPYIPKGTLNSMFDRYLGQTANYNKIGFCMKLYYTSQIVNAHHGKIVAYSDPSNKNTLGFTIPREYECVPAIA